MKTKNEYLSEFYVIQFEHLSNSGKTSFGVKTIFMPGFYGLKANSKIPDSYFEMPKRYDLLFCKKYTEMTDNEKSLFKKELDSHYKSYIDEIKYNENLKDVQETFLKNNKSKLKFPIYISCHYEEYDISYQIDEKEIDKYDVIRNMEDFDAYDDNVELLFCIVNNLSGWNWELDISKHLHV